MEIIREATDSPDPASGRAPKRRRPVVLFGTSLAVFVVLLFALELIGRLAVWLCEIPTEFTPEPFQGFGQTDPVLWWVLQPDLDIESQGVRVCTNGSGFRDARDTLAGDALRVFCLGDSTTFGWRVQAEEMYTARTEELLYEKLRRPVAVVSAGVPGYTSYQIELQFREKILPHRPNVLCVLVGNNESRARTMGDRERGQKLARKQALHRLLGFSHFWVLISRGPESLRRGWELDAPPGRVANSPSEYRENLQELIQLARDHGVRVVLMTVPLRLRFEPTWKTFDGPTDAVAALLLQAQQARFAGESLERQAKLLEDAVRIEPKQFTGHWRLAQLYLELGRNEEAEGQFQLASDGDLHPETAKPSYNRILEELSTTEAVPLLDLHGRFADSGLPDNQLFFDHCHPTPAGHQIIAEALAEQLIRLLAE